jgi:hypothetical protein
MKSHVRKCFYSQCLNVRLLVMNFFNVVTKNKKAQIHSHMHKYILIKNAKG